MGAGFFLFLFVAVPSSGAASVADLRFTDKVELESIRLWLPLPDSSRAIPSKPIDVRLYSVSNGEQTWIEERCSAVDLWFERQYDVCWVDAKGNVLTLAEINRHLPPALVGQYLTRESFESVIDSGEFTIDRREVSEKLAVWMANFCGSRVVGSPETLTVNKSRLAKVIQFKLEDPLTKAYAFRFNPQYPGQAEAPRNWFALVLSLSAAPDSNTDRNVSDNLIGQIKTTSSLEGTRASSIRKNRSRNPQADVREDDVRIRARRSIEFMEDWWYMDSENYILLSDSKTAEPFSVALLDELESLRPYFEAAVPKFKMAFDNIGVLRLFENEADYIDYLRDDALGFDPRLTGGIFSSSRRELVIRPTSTITSDREGSVRSIIRHEGFHQYLFAALGGMTPSAWVNEGFAVFFENSEVLKNGDLEVHESGRHSEMLENLVKDTDLDWEKLLPGFLDMDYSTFYANAEIDYAIAYGLVYYLMKGAPLERNKPYAEILPKYFAELEKSGDAEVASHVAFEKVDRNKFCNDFVSFWKTPKKRQDALRKPGF